MSSMRKTDRINRFLPLPLGDGDRVSKFSKKCTHCGHIVTAEHMHGIATSVKAQIALAAEAECPACRRQFPVACLITEDKRVLRVMLPMWLFRFYLQLIAKPAPPMPIEDEIEQSPVQDSLSLEALEDKAVDALLGTYQGKPIYAWVKNDSQYYDFERVFAGTPHERIDSNELLVETCLIYRRRQGLHNI
ncbi:hypothetical protein HNQ59_002687 [Chitinivorax tropicus]|uniref:Uncharacterized protein n=1 Tax=Chitinivorax tropicus TaxID=714531 RepID=A0A840MSK1_9PROT|nr:hypothetical protein [Chitinivorax tropicus]MBB5019386.1 hypothetical protein [Chitinivorax tropicus]